MLRRLADEPLVLFAALGAVFYGAWLVLAPQAVETIQLERRVIEALEAREVELLGRPLTDEEKRDVEENLIEEEVLLREAMRRGLQWSDGRPSPPPWHC